jgi:hypothetical protein
MNVAQLRSGSELVGGDIALAKPDLERLPVRMRLQHKADDAYLQAVTRLESLVDADPHDPWPGHYHHFGASLVCITALYRRVGGLPKLDCLEDVALVEAAKRADVRLRHSLAVKVVTAARVAGRARVGLASQLREWQCVADEPLVDSAAFLKLYFTVRGEARRLWQSQKSAGAQKAAVMAKCLRLSEKAFAAALEECSTFGDTAVGETLRVYATAGATGNSHAPDRRWLDSQRLLA